MTPQETLVVPELHVRPLKQRRDGKQAFPELPITEESKRAAGYDDRPFDLGNVVLVSCNDVRASSPRQAVGW